MNEPDKKETEGEPEEEVLEEETDMVPEKKEKKQDRLKWLFIILILLAILGYMSEYLGI